MIWENARVLVAGSSGFLGRHIVACLRAQGCNVVGVVRKPGRRDWPVMAPGVREIANDLRDIDTTRAVVKEISPTHVFHVAGVLGGQSSDWINLFEGNVLTTINLLGAIRAERLSPWVVVASSSSVYGPGADQALVEELPFRPMSSYGVSKAAQELVALQAELHGTEITRARLFNLVGPGQPASLVISDIARQIAVAEHGGPPIIEVGSLEPERDYVDVRDAAAAMVLLARRGAPSGPYNIATGSSHSVGQCVQTLRDLAMRPVTFKSIEARRRTVDIPRQVGDCTKLRSIVDWRPAISFQDSLSDVLDYWRERIAKKDDE